MPDPSVADLSAYREEPVWPRAHPLQTDVAGVAVDDARGRVYLFARADPPVIVLSPAGEELGAWGRGVFTRAHGITVGPDGSVFCTDDSGHAVRKFTPDGELLMTLGRPGQPADTGVIGHDPRTVKRAGPPFNLPTNLAVAPGGDLYVTDGYGNARVHRFSADGRLLASWGEPGAGPGQFCLPHGVAVLPDGRVLVADRENDRVQVFSPDGAFLAEWTGLRRPTDLFVAPGGRVLVSELGTEGQAPSNSGISAFDAEGRRLGHRGGTLAAHALWAAADGALYVGEVAWTIYSGQPPAGATGVRKFVPA